MDDPIIGYLAPDGKFTSCTSYEHSSCATWICRKLGFGDTGYEAEQRLLNLGYICFRSRDAFMNYFRNDVEERIPVIITDEQEQFIKENIEHMNNLEQLEDVNNMLEYSQYLKDKERNR